VQRVTKSSLKISAQFAKRYYFATFRMGILESSGGVGMDLHFFDDALSLRVDAFDFALEEKRSPRLRAALRVQALNHLFATVGVDDLINSPVREVSTGRLILGRDFFVGAGVYFTDEDLQAILTLSPIRP
jgi:phospholipid/cholesterol/gamma-HCH transport system substrate-binding protein